MAGDTRTGLDRVATLVSEIISRSIPSWPHSQSRVVLRPTRANYANEFRTGAGRC